MPYPTQQNGYIVELEPGVWLAEGDGDPPRTLRRENAKIHPTKTAAGESLYSVRDYRKFKSAKIEAAW